MFQGSHVLSIGLESIQWEWQFAFHASHAIPSTEDPKEPVQLWNAHIGQEQQEWRQKKQPTVKSMIM